MFTHLDLALLQHTIMICIEQLLILLYEHVLWAQTLLHRCWLLALILLALILRSIFRCTLHWSHWSLERLIKP